MYSNSSFKTKVAEISEIPKDVLLGITILTILGETEINIDNHKGIIEYTDSNVKIRTKSGKLLISGKNLLVDSYSNDEMIIKGMIHSIDFNG